MKNMKKLNERLDIWFDLMFELEGFEDDILKPLHDRLSSEIFRYNTVMKLWDWTGKNLRLSFTEKERLSYFNEGLDKTDERRIRVLKYYGLLWEENIR